MAASCQSEMNPLSQCLMGNRWKVGLSRLLPMLSPETWAASSKFIGEPEHDQDLVVSDIQTSRPFEAWLNTDRSRSGEVLGVSVQTSVGMITGEQDSTRFQT